MTYRYTATSTTRPFGAPAELAKSSGLNGKHL